jgi:hypothetical protein
LYVDISSIVLVVCFVKEPGPVGLATIFYCPRFETSLFVASYDSQGCSGGIRPRLHTGVPTNDWVWVLCYDRRSVGRTEERSLPPTVRVLFCFISCHETCVNPVATLWLLPAYPLPRNVFNEPLPSNGLFRVYWLPRERSYRTVSQQWTIPAFRRRDKAADVTSRINVQNIVALFFTKMYLARNMNAECSEYC